MGKFVVGNTKSGGFKFNLKAGNGEIIATSEDYTTKAACLNGIESIKKNCGGDIEDQTVAEVVAAKCPKFEVYNDKAGEFRFRLKATNGEIIAVGQAYTTKAACLNGIESIKKNAPEAEVIEELD